MKRASTTPFAVAIAAAALTGCASSGPVGSDVLTGSIKTNTARLVIYRVSPLGFAVQPGYLLNGQKIANSTPNGFVVCDLPPGKTELAVDNTSFNINLFGGSDKASLNLAPGTTTFVRADPQPGVTIGIIMLTQVTESQGRADSAALHKIESTCKA